VHKLNPDGTLKSASTGSAEKRAREEKKLMPVFVHGWVHDIETGKVFDLNVSTGPAGFENFTPSETPETEAPATTSEGESSADRTTVATPTASLEVEGASSEVSTTTTTQGDPIVTSDPSDSSSVEVKVHGSGSRTVDAPAKIK
jgi:hypothetical protein